MLVKVEN